MRIYGPTKIIIPVVALAAFALLYGTLRVYAASIDELKAQISEKSEEIKKLEEEERTYQNKLTERAVEVKNLTGQIGGLDSSIKKLTSDIRITEVRISRTELEIKKLLIEIQDKERTIERQIGNVGSLARLLQRSDDEPVIAQLIKYPTLARFFNVIHALASAQQGFREYLVEIRKIKDGLNEKHDETEKKQHELQQLSATLGDQRVLQQSQRSQRANLLATTKNQEKLYQKLLEDNKKRQLALEQEIADYERQIQVIIDPASLPKTGSSVLGWPLPEVALSSCFSGTRSSAEHCITQFFGNTAFALAGGYKGKGHNGVDFRAGLGTPVFASESGVVRDVGDTDVVCRGVSYGKWILIDFQNNLSAIYAHLSLIKVLAGHAVRRGDLIGYSGVSGYATGPHLHFGVYAKQAVTIAAIPSAVCPKKKLVIPVSPYNGYLNPVDYL
ncbi:MAG: hypothetical protein A2676_00980 [Candidatus Sungbacteria bacterium RIFCSPHIGHO2_01_FULL_51_22]|nr:MAG: hypothetical protein A2676_00980 [Candidatus Sungbacteria bacterium RIFCSPHIGHO2_01_FULL_51_22]